MSEENKATETEVVTPTASPTAATDDLMPRSEAENLLKALKAEREARKQYEKQVKDQASQLERFAQINPDEWDSMQAEAAKAAQLQAQFGEAKEAIELKYSKQAEAAASEASIAKAALADYQKKYALEKVFFAAGGRTDSADGVSFFDMLATQIGSRFRQEDDGSLVVVDDAGDPVLDKESGKRVNPDEFIASFKTHPIYGTFFKGQKGSGAGIGYGGTDANGIPTEDLASLSRDELFRKAFGS